MANHMQNLDSVFHDLADPTRRAIVLQLSRNPATVSALHEPERMALPTLLQHIRVLELSGLIITKKAGRVRTCELRPVALRVTEAWLARQRALWQARLDRLDDYALKLHAEEKQNVKRKSKGR